MQQPTFVLATGVQDSWKVEHGCHGLSWFRCRYYLRSGYSNLGLASTLPYHFPQHWIFLWLWIIAVAGVSCFAARYRGLVHITKVLTVIDADVILHPMYFEHISRDIAAMKDLCHVPVYKSCACKHYIAICRKEEKILLTHSGRLSGWNHQILRFQSFPSACFPSSRLLSCLGGTSIQALAWAADFSNSMICKATKHCGHQGTNLLPQYMSLLKKSVVALPLQHSWCEESVELCQTVR